MNHVRLALGLCLLSPFGCGPAQEAAVPCEASGPSGVVDGVFPLAFRNAEPVAVGEPLGRDPLHAVALSIESTGADVPGTLVDDYFYPDEPLSPDTEFRWFASTGPECTPAEGTFETSELGGAVDRPEDLIGRVFEVYLTDGKGGDTGLTLWGVGSEWSQLLMRIDSIGVDEATVTLADHAVRSREQYGCTQTRQVTGAWDGARLTLAGDRLTAPIGKAWFMTCSWGGYEEGHQNVELLDWRLELVVHPNGGQVTTSKISFVADTRGLSDWSFHQECWPDPGVTPGAGTPENFCTLFPTLSGEPFCTAYEDGVVACFPVDNSWRSEPGQMIEGLYDVGATQTENHLCEASCTNGLDDDDDGGVDTDAECNSGAWP